ncbi:50S ribosomal protein L33 [Candidatus Falkowbacteria bacterium CG10_big_fil_rev_8_21_14_0_10_39_11]|uniref:Large ribosomal subunit protein bL33 n=1 Tax=Candidatus Falkowbacteria bacterium CG10_big_fil_rev_8_21_14_0_10_39_11 TaxID=1974565 RepID=A0A2H0V4Z6_9BACT|nr:MAG: 50S ribosomal protein L33 [Candidatus Falkowbacteria bacterium CG10_big_fil_rev_8_21_14_0_10_39_11]
MSQDNLVKLQCTDCRSINYQSQRNKKKLKDKLELKKFCNTCRNHTQHKEVK